MRQETTKIKTIELLAYLGNQIQSEGSLYLTGGATAVLIGWRDKTIDVDCKFEPEPKGIFEAIQRAKEKFDINIELASPDHFIPTIPDWDKRSHFIGKFGKLTVYHYDFYSQALAKIDRGHERDLLDVENMVRLGLIDRQKVWDFFNEIARELIRFPSINESIFSSKVQKFVVGK